MYVLSTWYVHVTFMYVQSARKMHTYMYMYMDAQQLGLQLSVNMYIVPTYIQLNHNSLGSDHTGLHVEILNVRKCI